MQLPGVHARLDDVGVPKNASTQFVSGKVGWNHFLDWSTLLY